MEAVAFGNSKANLLKAFFIFQTNCPKFKFPKSTKMS